MHDDCQHCGAVAVAIVETGSMYERQRFGNVGVEDSG
jgi:hypothetical protein